MASDWPPWIRTVFVLRAVAGFTTAETALLLKTHGGPQAGERVVEFLFEVLNQNSEVVMTQKGVIFFLRRAAEEAAP